MRLVTFEGTGGPRLGAHVGDRIVDLAKVDLRMPRSLHTAFSDWDGFCEALPAIVGRARGDAVRAFEGARLLPPTAEASKIICLGINYLDHAAEGGFKKPDRPVVFLRVATSLVGHQAPIIRPSCSDMLDYEGEMVAFIGRHARNIDRGDALSAIAGYSIFNDGSIRDWQFGEGGQWTLGKNFDSTGGFGPEFVSADELPPGGAGLHIETRLSKQVVQSANTDDMIFGVAETVALLSTCMTLNPGDLLVMGTPAGIGGARKPPLWMKPGDVCEVDIEGVGVLRNPIEQQRALER